jgi:formyl-CoA transferase
MVTAFESPALAADPRFATRAGRVDGYAELRLELEAIAATKPRAYWAARLEHEDVPYAPVQSIDEALADPQIAALGTFYSTPHPTQGPVTSIRRPAAIDGERAVNDRPPPALGEHTAEVLAPTSDWRR